jgi:para-nitrobenzyl esterase
MDGVVEVGGGRVRGVERSGVWSFSGIPYGASTAGEGRWRPPAPPRPWAGVRDCDRFGPIAPQAPGTMETMLGAAPADYSEDCLSLNLWTPGLDVARRPVMVWVHGGSFTGGSGSDGFYRGGLLAREHDVVVVTINYRLGMLGFLAHPALAEPGQTLPDGTPWTGWANWGLADQVGALGWVRDHVADFGGDPGNVTVFGESAGGMSVSALLAAPAAAGLFHRAVVQSGPPLTASASVATERAERIAAHLGVPCTRAGLGALPADRLVAAVGELAAGSGDAGLLLLPVVDGGLLTRPPLEAVAAGSVVGVPLLVGTTRDEWTLFAIANPGFATLDPDRLRRWVQRLIPDPDAVEAVIDGVTAARAERGESTEPKDLWTAIATEFVFRVGTDRLADAHASAALPGTGTYSYLFTWESPIFGGVLGSCHALEVPFVFGSVRSPGVQTFSGGGDDALALSEAMRQAWTSFARSGVPECDLPGTGAVPWERWDRIRRPTTVLGPWPGVTGQVHRVDDPRGRDLDAVAAAAGPEHGHHVS